MRKVFVSYHHRGDAAWRSILLHLNALHGLFIDGSVDTGEVPDALTDQEIRERIRDHYLRDTTVTIVLVGAETRRRKHIDWEIYSSMHDGKINKKSGLLAIMLPTVDLGYFTAAHEEEKRVVYPENDSWTSVNDRAEYERRYPALPARIVDNLLAPRARISVTNWARIEANPQLLAFLIDTANADRTSCEYDLSRPLRRASS